MRRSQFMEGRLQPMQCSSEPERLLKEEVSYPFKSISIKLANSFYKESFIIIVDSFSKNLKADKIKDWCQKFDIKLENTATYHLAGNLLTERTIGRVKTAIGDWSWTLESIGAKYRRQMPTWQPRPWDLWTGTAQVIASELPALIPLTGSKCLIRTTWTLSLTWR